MEIEKKAGFDASKPFVVPILSGGEKSCEVRFPSDEEWCAWARAQRTVRHFLGVGSRRARTWTCRRSTLSCSPRSAPTRTVPSSMMPRPVCGRPR